MAKDRMKIGEVSRPRFEFRTFGQDFADAEFRMSRLSTPVSEKVWERTSNEIYIMSRKNDNYNAKIRGGKMDIKTFIKEKDGLEQWIPLIKAEFPIPAATLRDDVYPAFQVEMPNLKKDSCTLDEFLQMIHDHPDLLAVKVNKQRFGYMVNNTICEVGNVLINGALVVTISSESTELGDIIKTMNDVGLNGVENINYVQCIKRVIGWIDKDLAN